MNKTEIMNSITRTFYKANFQLKKHSPEILVVSGIIGMTTSAVLACKATTKAGTIIEETKNSMHDLHLVSLAAGIESKNKDAFTHEDIEKINLLKKREDVKSYTKDDLKKDTTITYAQTAVKFIKLYGPAVVLGIASITSILAGHNIIRKRNVALAAAYATVDKSFKQYRSHVVERFGDELDKELRYNIKAKEIEKTVTDEKGKEKKVKEVINVADDPNKYSDFARIFDEYCVGWSKDPESNLVFLKQQQNWANEKLQSKGYLFLNEVYEMLGFPITKAGASVGWIYDKNDPVGDNFVDFGIYNMNSQKAHDFVNGYERSIILDFNVDGPIIDMF